MTFHFPNTCEMTNNTITIGMIHQIMTFVFIMAALNILATFVSIITKVNTEHDKNEILNKIVSELETANQIRIVENCMNCGFCEEESEDEKDSGEDGEEDGEDGEDNEEDGEDNEEDGEDGEEDGEDGEDGEEDNEEESQEAKITEILAEIERIATRKIISNCNNLDVTEIAAAPAAMESKSEEDSIESAH